MTEQQAIKTLTNAGWVELQCDKGYKFEKGSKILAIKKAVLSATAALAGDG